MSGLNPIKALYWSAVINAVISVPVMVAVMMAATRPKLMNDLVLPPVWKFLGWLATLAMAAATAAMFWAMLSRVANSEQRTANWIWGGQG